MLMLYYIWFSLILSNNPDSRSYSWSCSMHERIFNVNRDDRFFSRNARPTMRSVQANAEWFCCWCRSSIVQPLVICKLIYCLGISISFLVYRMCYHFFFHLTSPEFLWVLVSGTLHILISNSISIFISHTLLIRDRFIIFITSSLFLLNGLNIAVSKSKSARPRVYLSYIFIFDFIKEKYFSSILA